MHDELKNKVTSRAGIDYAAPSDCKRIAEDIFEATHKKVSVTTLKRFFGFASLKHELSKYTLAVLKEYTESDCTVIINMKIDPAKGKIKNPVEVRFELQNGSLYLGNCINSTDLDSLLESQKKDVSIKVRLTKTQVKNVVERINKITK